MLAVYPEQFALLLGWVAPAWPALLEPVTDNAFRFAQHDRNILIRMQAVADEEGDHNEVSQLGQPVTVANARLFFHEDGVDFTINILRPNQVRLAFDGLAGVLIPPGAMAGNEQSRLLRPGRAGEGGASR